MAVLFGGDPVDCKVIVGEDERSLECDSTGSLPTTMQDVVLHIRSRQHQ